MKSTGFFRFVRRIIHQFARISRRLAGITPNQAHRTTPAKSARTWFECYLLLVSFLSLLGILGCGAGTIAGLVHMFAPDSFLEEYVPNKHRNNDTYWRWIGQSFNRQHELYPRPSEEELTRKGLQSEKDYLDQERSKGRPIAILSGFAMLLCLVALRIHWRSCPKVTPNIPT